MKKGKMHLLEQELQRLQSDSLKQMKNITVLHINHFMDNTLVFNEILQEVFGKVVFMGAPYYTGISEANEEFSPNYACYYGTWKNKQFVMYCGGREAGTYQGDFQEVCGQMLENVMQRELLPAVAAGQRILVLEDGGYVCRYLHQWISKYPELKGKIVGSVEQTTSGTRLDKYYYGIYGYEFPCVSIARSDLKMDVEALFIVNRIIRELDQILYEQNTFLEFHQVLILGYGVLGRAAANLLKKRNVQLWVYDADPRMRRLAQKEKYRVIQGGEELRFPVDTIIIGLTGEEAFTLEMLNAFARSPAKRLYLASGSSKQTEFQSFLRYAKQNGMKNLGGKACYTLMPGKDKETKEIYLLAEGMPLNFYSKTGGSLTVSIIDFIFTEMLLCGAWMCKEQMEKRMYLVGTETIPELNEERLFQSWCKLYGLINKYPKAHPEKEYLRRKTYEKENS